jgi:hypothetical protein
MEEQEAGAKLAVGPAARRAKAAEHRTRRSFDIDSAKG